MIETLTLLQATRRLREEGLKISEETVRLGIEQNRFPFGDVIQSKKGTPICIIYSRLLEQWIAKRSANAK